jgi:elongation factor P
MDNETYDQIAVPPDIIGENSRFLKEGERVTISFNGSEIVGIELPILVELKIVQTVPGIKGDTATGGTKPATVETGATVNVPLFLNEGDIIRIDTRTGEYVERVKVE